MTSLMVAQLQRPTRVEQTNKVRHMRTLVVTDNDDLQPPMQELVESLQAVGCRLSFAIARTGSLSVWLSSKRIYYYLGLSRLGSVVGADGSATPAAALAQLQQLVRNFDAVVVATASPVGIAARIAAAQAGVPVRVSLAAESANGDVSLQAMARKCRQLDSAIPCQQVSDVVAALVGTAKPISAVTRLSAVWLGWLLQWRFAQGDRKVYLPLKRSADVLVSLILLAALSPLALLAMVYRLSQGQNAVESVVVQGKDSKPFTLYAFAREGTTPVQWRSKVWWIPSLFNVLLGQSSLVGPRLLTPEQAQSEGNRALYYWVAPGLCAWSRVRAGAAENDAELTGIDNLYIASLSLILDAKILAMGLVRALRK